MKTAQKPNSVQHYKVSVQKLNHSRFKATCFELLACGFSLLPIYCVWFTAPSAVLTRFFIQTQYRADCFLNSTRSALVQWIWFFCHPKSRGCALSCKHRLQAAWAPLCCSSVEMPSAANPRTRCCCLPELCQCLLRRDWQSLGVCKTMFTLLGATTRQKSGVRKNLKIT